MIRPIRPEDKGMLADGLRRLSPESAQRRFLTPKRSFSRAELRYLTEVDGRDHVALVAEYPCYPVRRLIAVGRFVIDQAEPDAAEVAVTVADEWQGRGLGSVLGAHLSHLARNREHQALHGHDGEREHARAPADGEAHGAPGAAPRRRRRGRAGAGPGRLRKPRAVPAAQRCRLAALECAAPPDPMNVSVPKETAEGERRVALVPEVVQRLTGEGLEVTVEPGAGEGAHHPDASYEDAGGAHRRRLLAATSWPRSRRRAPRRSAGWARAPC